MPLAESPASPPRPDYGLDAPGVVRNLFLVGALGALVAGGALLGLWSGTLVLPLPGLRVLLPLTGLGLSLGASCTGMGAWMVWAGRVGKVRRRAWLLQQLPWTGSEQVLDVGCGRGLLLVGAARRLTTGQATGLDKWQAEDLSGNRPEAALENARREGVAARVAVVTGDMRRLPFPDQRFDLVVSRAAIHNLYQAPERAQALAEIVRVLTPGGWALIDDIRHQGQYTRVFTQLGCTVQRLDSPWVAGLLWLLTFGALAPATLRVHKPAGAARPRRGAPVRGEPVAAGASAESGAAAGAPETAKTAALRELTPTTSP